MFDLQFIKFEYILTLIFIVKKICQSINEEESEWTVVQPNSDALGPYAYNENQWVGYDDEAIVRKKSEFVVELKLGGIMFW